MKGKVATSVLAAPNYLDHHKVDMLPVNQVAALINEALRMQIRGSRPEIQPSAPEDRYKQITPFKFQIGIIIRCTLALCYSN